MTDQSSREMIKSKLRQHFDGKIVRKDLTKKIKEGANVPVYVLEFLLGQYCCSDNDEIIYKGVQTVKRILADNFVRPDEAQKILARLRSNGSHTVIDMVTASLDIRRNSFYADFSNLGLQDVPIDDSYPEQYDRLLCGGIWCIVGLDYEYDEEEKEEEEKDITEIEENVWRVAGFAETQKLSEVIGFTLPEDADFSTLGGMIMNELSAIPDDGDADIEVETCGLHIKVEQVEDRRIECAIVTKLPSSEDKDE